MKQHSSDFELIQRLCFRLLPIQVLLAVIGSVNGIVSSLFATNFIGADAMSAVGLYGPLGMLFGAVNTMLMGGTQIICGKHMGKNQVSAMQNVFSLNLLVSVLFSAGCAVLLFAAGALDLTGIFTKDAVVRGHFNQYLMGMALSLVPMFLGQQLSGFLSLENKTKLTTIASLAYILTNLLLDYLFVVVFRMEVLGLALATALGLLVFTVVQALFYIRGKSMFKLTFRKIVWSEGIDIVKTGAPGALSYGYQSIRGIIVNALTLAFVGSAGISAFATSNSFLGLFWAIPSGMVAVSRMLLSVSMGEEDSQSMQDVMKVMFRRYLPLMSGIAALLIVCAVPLTRLYYQDMNDPVFMMTVWGFRLLPISMPLSIICMHFVCYSQIAGKKLPMHLLPLADGVLGSVISTAILIPFIGMNSVYWANIINGIITTIIVWAYAWACNRKFPTTIPELMVIPKNFGASPKDRMDITVRSMQEVVTISRQVQTFCREKGVDDRRSYLAALMVEEMAGNIVSHGFEKDSKKHSVDMRIVYKEQTDELILRIKDDCVPFDPAERQKIVDPDDITKNIGIRMVYSLAKSIQYQNILGLNALVIKL